jgi:N-methylhydantoinase B
MTLTTDLDPITAQVVRDSFEFVSEEMSRVVERSAVHPLFQEVHDYSTGVFFYDGEDVSLIARATAMPVHIFASVASVQAIVDAFGDDIHEGDVFLLNDPYAGGSHQADWTMMKPVLLEGGGMVIPSVRAHMSDFGGVAPGGYYPDAREVWQEGYRIPPVRLYERGVLRQDLWDLILGNSRLTPTLTGDLMAIVGGCNVGAQRTAALVAKYGPDLVRAGIAASMDYAERRFREVVRSWPDGTYHGESVLDHDSGGTYDVTVRAAITVDGEQLSVDLDGSDPQVPGYINSVYGNTASWVYIALYAAMPDDVPVNSGLFRRVDIKAPQGTVVNPLPPAPVMFSTVTIGGDIGEAVMKALEHIDPTRVGNVGLGYNACTAYGWDDRYGDQMYFTIEYGNTLVADGGAYGKDGWGGWSAPMATLIFATIETQELQFPFVYDRYEYLDDSCAPGRWRGAPAFALERRLVGSHPGFVNITVENNRHPLQGYAGGQPAVPSYAVFKPGTDQEQVISESVTAGKLEPGEAIATVKGAGGGWGPPRERDPQAVLDDYLDGYVSAETAERDYGVVLVVDGVSASVDVEATRRLRGA